MLRFRACAAVGLLLGVSGCAGTNQRLFTQSASRDGAVRSPFLPRANRDSGQFPVVAAEPAAVASRPTGGISHYYPSLNPRTTPANATESGDLGRSAHGGRSLSNSRLSQPDPANEPSSELPLSLNIDVPSDGPRTRVGEPAATTIERPAIERASRDSHRADVGTARSDHAVVTTSVEQSRLPAPPVEPLSANAVVPSVGSVAEYAPPPPRLAQAPEGRSRNEIPVSAPILPDPSVPNVAVQQGDPIPTSAQYEVDSSYLASGQAAGCGLCSKCGHVKKPCFLKSMFQKPCCLSGLFQKPCFLTKCFQKPCFLKKCFHKKGSCLASPQCAPTPQCVATPQCAPEPVCRPTAKKCVLPPLPSKQMPMAQNSASPGSEPALITASNRTPTLAQLQDRSNAMDSGRETAADQPPRPLFNRMWTASIDPTYATARPVSLDPSYEPAPARKPRRSLLARLWGRSEPVNAGAYSMPAPTYAGAPAPPTLAAVTAPGSVAGKPGNFAQQGQADDRVAPSSFSEPAQR